MPIKCFLVLFFCGPFLLNGQTFPHLLEEEDSTKISYHYADNPDVFTYAPDTLLDNFQQYHPARQTLVDYMHLGNLGNAAKPILYRHATYNGLDFGLHQYDLFQTSRDQVRFYNVNKALTEAYYSQQDQENSFFKARYAQQFSDGISANFYHSRINQIGSYSLQQSKHFALEYAMSYKAPNDKYSIHSSFTSNIVKQEDNGGIVSDTFLTTPFYEERLNIPVELEDARTIHKNNSLSFFQYVQVQGKTDSTNLKPKRNYKLSHGFEYNWREYKFYDVDPTDDTLYYANQLLDERGMRHFVKAKKIENSLRVITNRQRKNSEGIEQESDYLEVGLIHQFHKINQEPIDSNVNNLLLRGRWNFSPNNGWKIKLLGQYNLLAQIGDYRMTGELAIDLKNLGRISAFALNQRHAPSLLQDQLFIAQKTFWDSDFEKPIETTLKGSYELEKFNFKATAAYHLVNNMIYYDSLTVVQQSGIPISIGQLIVEQDVHYKGFSLTNTIALQQASEDFLRLPDFFSKHSLYWQGNLFKRALLLQAGVDLRMNSTYFADAYSPVTGQFYLQNEYAVEFYPLLDVFMNFKVKSFRFFAKLENITDLWTEETYFQVPNHPMTDMSFRFGISWRWWD